MNRGVEAAIGVRRGALGAAIAGSLLTAMAYWLDRPHIFQSWLSAWLFFLGIALGSMANVMIHELTGGAWGFAIRRPAEAAMATLPVLAILSLPLALGLGDLYPWVHEGSGPRHWYLNTAAFETRTIIYFALWLGASSALIRYWRAGSTNAAKTPMPPRPALRRLCIAGLLIYALTMTLAAVDWIMSLSADWHSTTFGLLIMVGQSMSGFAFAVACAVFAGYLRDGSPEAAQHARDLGNLLLTLVMLWVYLAFTQFLIIWAEDLPGEIGWYIPRAEPKWRALAIAVLALQFAVPVLAMLFRSFKRSPRRLGLLCAIVLVGHWGELLWLVAPPSRAQGPVLRWTDLAATLAIGGFWLARLLSGLANPRFARPPDAAIARHG